MKSRNHFPLYQVAFGVMLMMVFFGWLVVLLELVQRDAEISDARVREAEERYLQNIAERFAITMTVDRVTEGYVKLGAENGVYSGAWIPKMMNRRPVIEVEAWPSQIDPRSSQDMLDSRELLNWGETEDGRDRLGSRILKIAREEGQTFNAVGILREGVWRYDEIIPASVADHKFIGGLMNPGFRLLLIRELEKWEPSPKLERLKLAERIRAVEGRVSELPGEFEIQSFKGGEIDFFYTKKQLEAVIGDGDLVISETRPGERVSVRVKGLEKWPYLSLKEGQSLDTKAEEGSKRAIYFIGFCTLLSTVGLVWGAVWIGRRQLQQARARTDLAASMAHELRTPLAGQRVVLESMLSREKFDESYLQMALRENERLSDLSEEFLTFSRLERGVLELQLKPLDLSKVVKSVVNDFSAHHENSKIKFIEGPEVKVDADESAISTLVRNFLENAWKYSREPREIVVEMIEGGFEVRDNGVGLSPAEQKKIFRQFYRVEKELSRSQDGLGLGLSIVKRLVDAMNGKVEVKSEMGKGSAFAVRFEKGGQE